MIEREHTVSFDCTTCGKDVVYDSSAAFKEHLKSAHNVTEFKGSGKMVFHLDTATHFISTHECEIGGVKFFRTTNTERENAFKLRQLKATK